MKNTYQQMLEIPEFKEFMREFTMSANYFAACGNAQQEEALLLCLAYAFKAGLKAAGALESKSD